MIDLDMLKKELEEAEAEKERIKKKDEILKNHLMELEQRTIFLREKLYDLKIEERLEEKNLIKEIYCLNTSKGQLNIILVKNIGIIEKLKKIKKLIIKKDFDSIMFTNLKSREIDQEINCLKEEIFSKKKEVEQLKEHKKNSAYFKIRKKIRKIEKSLADLMVNASILGGIIIKTEGELKEVNYKIYQIRQEISIEDYSRGAIPSF